MSHTPPKPESTYSDEPEQPEPGHDEGTSQLLQAQSTTPDNELSRAIHRNFTRRYGKTSQPPQWSAPVEAQTLQTHYNCLENKEQSELARKHQSKHQLMHLLEKVLVRFCWSILLSAAMIGCFKYFENVRILNDLEKNIFNVLSTMIYLTMGLNLAGAFKGMATMIRWKLLARKSHNLKEIDLILGIPSLIKVFKLGVSALGFGKPLVFVSCILWITLNCVARMSVAFTGLTYSYDSANATGTELGLVLVSEKSRFWPLGLVQEDPPAPGAEFQTAHFFGEYSAMMSDNVFGNVPYYQQILRWDKDAKEWTYNFREYNPDHQALIAVTNRTISVAATCNAYPIVKGQDGKQRNVEIYNTTDGISRVISDISLRGPGATVWANPRSDINKEDTWTCYLGPRCVMMAGFQFIDPEHEEGNGTLFQCAVNVGRVQNAEVAQHTIDDRVAFIAAGAIGLDGYTDDPQQWLYQRYFTGTTYGRRVNGDPDIMAFLLSRFAIGVIATMDIDNPKVEIVGMKPWSGVLFKVYWWMLLTILGSICGVQLVLGLTAVYYSNTVIVKDDSYLATARLLRPLVERLGPSGCALTGKDIASTLRTSMVYGVRVDNTGQRHHLDLGEDILPVKRFPDGWYDGDVGGMVPYTDEVGEKQPLLVTIREEHEDLLV